MDCIYVIYFKLTWQVGHSIEMLDWVLTPLPLMLKLGLPITKMTAREFWKSLIINFLVV